MKKLLFATLSMAFMLGACSKSDSNFNLSVSGLSDDANGKYAYVFDADNTLLDSVQIVDGTFKYATPVSDTISLVMNIQGTPVLFTPEAGNFTITYTTDSITGQPVLKRGGAPESVFMKIQALDEELTSIGNAIGAQINEVQSNVSEDGTLSEEQQAKLKELQDSYAKQFVDINRKYFEENTDNVINLISLQNVMRYVSEDEFVSMYKKAGQFVKNNQDLTEYYQLVLAAKKSGVGEHFTDFEMTSEEGEVKKLSEFKTQDKYFLVDFFASWCPPCKASMPILSEINKEFSKKVDIVSISVSDKFDDFKNIVEELNVNWAHFHDANNVGAQTYGISGIPTFILFNPEGEIIARTHDVKEVQNLLREQVK